MTSSGQGPCSIGLCQSFHSQQSFPLGTPVAQFLNFLLFLISAFASLFSVPGSPTPAGPSPHVSSRCFSSVASSLRRFPNLRGESVHLSFIPSLNVPPSFQWSWHAGRFWERHIVSWPTQQTSSPHLLETEKLKLFSLPWTYSGKTCDPVLSNEILGQVCCMPSGKMFCFLMVKASLGEGSTWKLSSSFFCFVGKHGTSFGGSLVMVTQKYA